MGGVFWVFGWGILGVVWWGWGGGIYSFLLLKYKVFFNFNLIFFSF
jgi:hypothetical protein